MREKLNIKIIVFTIVAIAILGYAYHRTGDLIRGPRVIITAPRNGAIFEKPLARVAGITENSAALTINGHAVFTNESGEFDDKILLSRGYNAIEISSEDRFGRTATKKIEVVKK